MNTSHPRPFFVPIVVYLSLLGVMLLIGDSYCVLWLPLLRVELTWLLPKDALMDVGIAMRAGRSTLRTLHSIRCRPAYLQATSQPLLRSAP